ncbi:MAG: DsbA family oxidoreductase [Gammaproteobacteria bacterium]|nr:DsbA family oxidoreductase [Gammaproteobacteria bacterium]
MSETLSNIVRSKDRVAVMAALHVDVIADFVCPFCFLGKRRLDEALKAVQGPFDVSWSPFQLNPDIPPEGQPFDVYLTRRFGSPANVEPVLEHLAEEGKASGVQFRFDRIAHVPSTLPIHQLMQHAGTLGADQVALADHLMSAFFEDGSNIGERGVLIDIASAHGISPKETGEAIGNDRIRQIVATREARARSSGLLGAPGFLINRRLLVVGAQPADALIGAFDRGMFGEGLDSLVSPAVH